MVEQTFAPVVDFSAVRIALAVSVQKGHLVHQMDVLTAFLHGEIDNDVYIYPRSGVDICGANECLKLKKGLYGLKQAPRLWNEKWKTVAKELGFDALKGDLCVF